MLNPVASHALARAAYKAGVPMWPGAVTDEVAMRVASEGPAGRPPHRPPPPSLAAGRAVTAFWALDYLILAVILASAVLVVKLRNLSGAVMALSAAGTMLSVLFVVLGAPDVAHSEVVVGAIALPVLYLVAIGKARTDVDRPARAGRGGGARP